MLANRLFPIVILFIFSWVMPLSPVGDVQVAQGAEHGVIVAGGWTDPVGG